MHKEIKSVNEKEFSILLNTLYQQIWSPLETALPKDTRDIVISPDGILNFVSFAALLAPDDQFLSQKYSISYVASGRDILHDVKPSSTQQMTVYADPDFTGKGLIASKTPSTNPAAMESLDMRDLQDLYLSPLPGTAKECDLLQSRLKKRNRPIEVFVRAKATERQLRSISSPYILHLATHGFFLPETDVKGLQRSDKQRGVGGTIPLSDIFTNVKTESTKHMQVI